MCWRETDKKEAFLTGTDFLKATYFPLLSLKKFKDFFMQKVILLQHKSSLPLFLRLAIAVS